MVKYFTYILQSEKDGKYYIGSTKNLDKRIYSHNRGSVASTKNRRPLELVLYEEFNSRSGAIKRERQIKNYKGGEAFKLLLK